jgi:radical SAM protein with 4Fe4S-binding SPASM domain
VIPDFKRSELHLNVGHESGHYFDNLGYPVEQRHDTVLRAIDDHRAALGSSLHPVRFLEDRYQALVSRYYETHKSPLPCEALASSCFIDPYWQLYPCSIWNESLGSLRDQDFDLWQLWKAKKTRDVRTAVVNEQCPHCWTPCEAYPTILGNLVKAVSPFAAPLTSTTPEP